jgi:hypothetical protein
LLASVALPVLLTSVSIGGGGWIIRLVILLRAIGTGWTTFWRAWSRMGFSRRLERRREPWPTRRGRINLAHNPLFWSKAICMEEGQARCCPGGYVRAHPSRTPALRMELLAERSAHTHSAEHLERHSGNIRSGSFNPPPSSDTSSSCRSALRQTDAHSPAPKEWQPAAAPADGRHTLATANAPAANGEKPSSR